MLQEPIGSGAFGEVWRAVDPHITRLVAVKILNTPKGLSARQKAEWEQRFLREARAAGMLSHPGIVTIHDVGMAEDGRPFIVMELINGVSLDAIIRRGPAPSERTALEWGAQVAEALDAAHRRGIVHRDVKPANVLIDKEGRARIADFGIARLSESDLTREGLFVGSPAFASPEQIRGGAVDGRSDLFSLGSALYTLVCGERPFRGEDLTSLAYAICHVEPAPLRRIAPRISSSCEAVIMKALAKDPKGRYQTGEELAEDLREAAAGRPPRRAVVARSAEATIVAPGRATAAERGAAGETRARRERRTGVSSSVPGAGAAMAIAVLMALGAAILGSYFLTQRPARPSSGTESAGAVASPPRPVSTSESAEEKQRLPLPRTGAAAAGVQPFDHETWAGDEAGADAAVVTVHLVHGLREGLLTIWSGQRRLLRARFEAAVKGSGAPGEEASSIGTASAEWRIRLPAGEHLLRVEVGSAEAQLDLDGEQSKTVQKRQRYRLHVRVKERPSPKLELMWTDD